METIVELQSLLRRLEAKWDGGKLSSSQEIVRLDRQMREIKKKIMWNLCFSGFGWQNWNSSL